MLNTQTGEMNTTSVTPYSKISLDHPISETQSHTIKYENMNGAGRVLALSFMKT